MPLVIGYFALAGILPFTIMLVLTAWSVARRLHEHENRLGPLLGGALSLCAIAGIDAAFGVLLVRAVFLALHPPAA